MRARDPNENSLTLPTRGRSMTVYVSKEKPKSKTLTHETLFRIQEVGGMSDKGLAASASVLRGHGDIRIEPNFHKKMTERNRELDHFFEVENVLFQNGPASDLQEQTRPLVYCTNTKEIKN